MLNKGFQVEPPISWNPAYSEHPKNRFDNLNRRDVKTVQSADRSKDLCPRSVCCKRLVENCYLTGHLVRQSSSSLVRIWKGW